MFGADFSARRVHDRAVGRSDSAGVFSWIVAPRPVAARARPEREAIRIEMAAAAVVDAAEEALRAERRDRRRRGRAASPGRSRSARSAPPQARPRPSCSDGLVQRLDDAGAEVAGDRVAHDQRRGAAPSPPPPCPRGSWRARSRISPPARCTSRRRPEWICPPFRPDAPLAMLFASTSTTSAPASARCSAAERPVKPPPTTQTSARREPSSGGYSGRLAQPNRRAEVRASGRARPSPREKVSPKRRMRGCGGECGAAALTRRLRAPSPGRGDARLHPQPARR